MYNTYIHCSMCRCITNQPVMMQILNTRDYSLLNILVMCVLKHLISISFSKIFFSNSLINKILPSKFFLQSFLSVMNKSFLNI